MDVVGGHVLEFMDRIFTTDEEKCKNMIKYFKSYRYGF